MREMTKVAKDFRLQQWIQEVKECQSRPKGMTVAQWCDLNGVKRDNYYYHLEVVRKAYLTRQNVEKIEKVEETSVNKETKLPVNQVVPVNPIMLREDKVGSDATIELICNGISIKVTDKTTPELLRLALEVCAGVK